jgi:hypothetical protein
VMDVQRHSPGTLPGRIRAERADDADGVGGA